MHDPAAPPADGRSPADRAPTAAPATPCTGGSTFHAAIPSRVEAIEQVVDAVVQRCADRAFPRRLVALNVPVALTEALANAILRGNREHPEKQVRVRACVDVDQLVVEVEDEGEGFDLDGCTHGPAESDFLEREDGRGLFLMRRLMDRVERFDAGRNGRADRGSVVRMTLRRG